MSGWTLYLLLDTQRYRETVSLRIFGAYLQPEFGSNPVPIPITISFYLEGIAHPVVDQLQLVGHPAGEEVALALVLGQVLAVRLRRLAREVVEHSDAGALIYII